MVQTRLILASASPRRQELLAQMGFDFEVFVPQVDEQLPGEPVDVVQALARRKAQAAAAVHPDGLILAADTLVYANGQTLGKPENLEEAAGMLRLLSGSWHEVFTGVCLMKAGKEQTAYAKTRVLFSPLTAADIIAYCQSGEPMGKAGAYAIQGLGGQFIEEIAGSYANVVGLPTALVRRMMMEFDDIH